MVFDRLLVKSGALQRVAVKCYGEDDRIEVMECYEYNSQFRVLVSKYT